MYCTSQQSLRLPWRLDISSIEASSRSISPALIGRPEDNVHLIHILRTRESSGDGSSRTTAECMHAPPVDSAPVAQDDNYPSWSQNANQALHGYFAPQLEALGDRTQIHIEEVGRHSEAVRASQYNMHQKIAPSRHQLPSEHQLCLHIWCP